MRRSSSAVVLVLMLGAGVSLPPRVARAQTPEAENRFIERLVQQGAGDLAITYLERADQDPLVPEAVRRAAPYRRAAILVDLATGERNANRRTQRLDEAAAAIRQLDRPADPTTVEAQALSDAVGRLALATADEARRAALAARNTERDSSKKLSSARGLLREAKSRLTEAIDLNEAELATLRGVVATSEPGRRRTELKLRLAQARLLLARLDNEAAATYPAGSETANRLNRAAAERLAELYEKYSKWVVGLYAHLYEGRCYRELGEYALATSCLESLITQPTTTPELVRLVILAKAELIALRVSNGELALAIESGEEWLKQIERSERTTAEAATLRYWLGEAYLLDAEAPQATETQRLRRLRAARENLDAAARIPSEQQALARARWANATAALGIDREKPETFADAYQAGKDAIDSYSAASVGLSTAEADDKSAREDFLAQQAEANEAGQSALEAALELSDRSSPIEQVNEARYLLAYLFYNEQRDDRAANLAATVALKSPDDPSAEAAARLALAALQRRGQQTLPPEERERVGANLMRLAEFTASKWPRSEAAEIALGLMLARLLEANDTAAARQLVTRAPETLRPALALRLAAAEWERLSKSAEVNESARSAARAELEERLSAAAAARAGVPLRATAALYLAEAALDAGQPTAAEPYLNDPEHGVLATLAAEGLHAERAAFAAAASRVATRALALQPDGAERFASALEQMVSIAASQPEPDQAIRESLLALALKQQADLTVFSEDESRRKAAVAALAITLARLAEPLASSDWNTSLWRCQSLLRLAEAAGSADDERQESLVRDASEAFAALAGRLQAEPGFAPSETAGLAVQLQLAECERRLGEHAKAYATFAELLAQRPALLEVQRSAALALQEWGASEKNAERIERAIAGDRPNAGGKNTVWGWAKLAAVAGQAMGNDPARRDLYFEAWLNVARARYAAANLATGEQRAAQLRKAASTVRAMQRQYPGLGGEERKTQFAQLQQQIETALNASNG
ncbi:hypothetical protein [Botrimarina hoheduenensis]|uniref:Tetratricopeptide repeat protein n=1 Tax=Botrimarina hoheduenensis TaxID=2528000 RepID=A0A5C5VX59_9BACT|nr:hypothetical protein [Botrimarina hoheduenensis]TWT43208.1 hypothetical protein Pla111_21580 [Botrimarina hoheduenensis]